MVDCQCHGNLGFSGFQFLIGIVVTHANIFSSGRSSNPHGFAFTAGRNALLPRMDFTEEVRRFRRSRLHLLTFARGCAMCAPAGKLTTLSQGCTMRICGLRTRRLYYLDDSIELKELRWSKEDSHLLAHVKTKTRVNPHSAATPIGVDSCDLPHALEDFFPL